MPINFNRNIDIGLAALVKHAPDGMTLSHQDIADVCGCHRRAIQTIEQRAVEKLKARLIHYKDYL